MARLCSAKTRVVMLSALALSLLFVMGCGNRYGEATALESKGDLDGAIGVYQEILAESPHDIQALTGLSVDLLQLKRFDEALAAEQEVAALNATDAQIRVELGFNYLNHQGQPDKAVAALGEAATLEPSARHLTYLAQAQIAAGDASAAEASLRKAIDLDKTYGHAYGVLIGLLEKQGRLSETTTVRQAAATVGATIPGDPSGGQPTDNAGQ